jgi:HSP20 family protein
MKRFDDLFLPVLPGEVADLPALNIWEVGDAVYVESELPGVAIDDLNIQVTAGELLISGKRNRRELPANATWLRRERQELTFSRAIELPWEIDTSKVEAQLRDGVLTLQLRKSGSSLPRRVPVTVS